MSNEATDLLMQEASGGTAWAKFKNVNDVVRGTIVSISKRQRTAFETNEPLTNKDGTPSEEIVVVLATDERDSDHPDDNGHRALHAPIWFFDGCLRVAIMSAVTEAGVKSPEVGGTLAVQHVGMDGKAKTYKAKYTPPNPLAADAPSSASLL